jgi:hypothetical protein
MKDSGRPAQTQPRGKRVVVRAVVESAAAHDARERSLLDVAVSECGLNAYKFVVSVRIAAPAEEIYALVDWADERNKWRQMGDAVTAIDDEGRRYRLVISYMPDVQFDHEVEEALRPEVYAFTGKMTPRLGHLEHCRSHYRMDAIGTAQTVLTCTTTAQFEADLNAGDLAQAVRLMTIACHNTAAKLKANAEHGVGTVEAFNATVLMPL